VRALDVARKNTSSTGSDEFFYLEEKIFDGKSGTITFVGGKWKPGGVIQPKFFPDPFSLKDEPMPSVSWTYPLTVDQIVEAEFRLNRQERGRAILYFHTQKSCL
jgi:hypothetical protein